MTPKNHKPSKPLSNRKTALGIAIAISTLVFLAGILILTKIDRNYPWVWNYVADRFQADPSVTAGPKHILFAFVDHYEPHDQETVSRWIAAYPLMAKRHRDADGKMPQHSWFWYFDKSDEAEKRSFLRQLSGLVYEGFGEIELHLHHWNDTEESFLTKIKDMIRLSQETGAMITAEPKPRVAFGFIHGLWSLDNSRGAGACGINNEIELLRKLDCYADFTHPSWGAMHPRTVNRLYYAKDDPARPKSYDSGPLVQVGKPPLGDLLIFEGPSVVRFNSPKPVYDHGDVTHADLPTPERIDAWVKSNIHVKGRPEWVFVKIFTHGALKEDHEAVLGLWRDKMHAYLEQKYNDGKNYVLHYVTAREAYNIAKAAEAGETGNPNAYRDFVIPRYVNRSFVASVPFEPLSLTPGQASIRFLAKPGTPVKVRFRALGVNVSGDALVRDTVLREDETVLDLVVKDRGVVGLSGERVVRKR